MAQRAAVRAHLAANFERNRERERVFVGTPAPRARVRDPGRQAAVRAVRDRAQRQTGRGV